MNRTAASRRLLPDTDVRAQQPTGSIRHGIQRFEFSEKTGEPILMRMVTRLAHSRSGVERKEQKPQNSISFSEDPRQFILLPGNARKRYKVLLARQDEFIKASEESPYNKYIDGPNKKLGIVACGIGYNYLMENYPEGCEYPVLKIGQYPLPKSNCCNWLNPATRFWYWKTDSHSLKKHLKGYLGIGIKVKDVWTAHCHKTEN